MLSHFLRKWWPFGRTAADPTEDRSADGFVWHVLPAAAPYFDVPALAEWVRTGRAATVKQNLQRTVYRVPLGAGTVYVKVCRANTPRAWAREILRPPKACLEFENALRLQSLGIGCTTPLAWAERDSLWPGDSVIVTREQTDAVPLDERLTQRFPAENLPVRRQVATELGRFVARLHDAGVRHPDPHPGNFLVEVPPSRVPHFFLLDVHSVRFGAPLTWAESRDNLVLLNRWFQMRATRADRGRFWRAYAANRMTLSFAAPASGPVGRNTGPEAGAEFAKEVEVATLESNLRFWAARTGRYLGNNRQFQTVRRGAVRGHVVRELPADVLEALLRDPDAVFGMPGVVRLKDSASATVAVVPLSAGGEGKEGFTLLKRFRLKKRFAALRNRFRRSPALRSWVNGHALADRGLPTARPLLVLHRHEHGLPREGYVLFELVEGVGLPEAVARFDRRELAGRLGRLLRDMHERQVSHTDLKAPNVLVTPAGDPVLIDLVGVTTGRVVSEAQRVQELTRLAASFATSVVVTHADRLRLLREYLGGGRTAWKSWWVRIASGVRAKVRRNANLGRPLG